MRLRWSFLFEFFCDFGIQNFLPPPKSTFTLASSMCSAIFASCDLLGTCAANAAGVACVIVEVTTSPVL